MLPFGLEVTQKPTVLPVPLSGPGSIREHLRILGRDALDSTLEELIWQAVENIEPLTLHSATTTSYAMTLDRFADYTGTSILKLPRFPVQSVTGIQYIDVEKANITLSPSLYQLSRSRVPSRIAPIDGQMWPFTSVFSLGAVRVEFTAGYATADAMPRLYKQAIKYLVAQLYYGDRMTLDDSFQKCIRGLKKMGFTSWS